LYTIEAHPIIERTIGVPIKSIKKTTVLELPNCEDMSNNINTYATIAKRPAQPELLLILTPSFMTHF
jgi:hypothetical protein